MSLLGLMTHSVDIYRQTAGLGRVMSRNKIVTAQVCMIQPMGADQATAADMAMARAYNIFFPEGTNIEIGDKLIDQNSITYNVQGLMDRKYGSNPHITVTAEREPAGGV